MTLKMVESKLKERKEYVKVQIGRFGVRTGGFWPAELARIEAQLKSLERSKGEESLTKGLEERSE